MEEKIKKKEKAHEKRSKRKSPLTLPESDEDINFRDSKRRKHGKDSERDQNHPRKKRSDRENREHYEYNSYWDLKEKGEIDDERIKDYIPRDRYWGGKGEDGDESVRNRRRNVQHFDDEKYLVGSRYYIDPKKKRTSPGIKRNEAKERLNEGEQNDNVQEPPAAPPPAKKLDVITSRTGGAYIPPGKLRLMQASITDKSSAEYQRIAWEALKKSIHGHINKVNTSNIGIVARLLFKENIIRGRGLLCRSIIQAQSASVTFTNVYACLVAIINSKFPNIGELLLKRVVIRFKRAYKRNDKAVCLSASTFIAHLINQRVAHEILGLELVTLLVENPTDDSIEVAVNFLKEAGQKLSEVTSKGTNAIFDMLRNILHEGKLEKRVQYMIEVMFQVRKDEFATFPSVPEELDLVDEEDQFTHLIGLDDAVDPQDMLNVFKLDSEYTTNEERYKELRGEILETDSEGTGSEGDSSSGEDASDEEEDEDQQDQEKKMTIIDNTETNLIAFRKTIYLTIQSSLDFEECAHKLLKMEIKPGQEKELCHMFLDCCAEQRTYEKFFGLLSQRFCQVNKMFISPFEEIFADTYATVHRLDTNRLRNVAKLFAHLLFTDAISWAVLTTIKLNEEDTTSSSRIFIKILFQELSEYMGLTNLNSRLKDPTLQSAMEGLFPRDNPKNTRFAINFFTSIGLGGLTDELREHLKNLPKPVPVSQLIQELSSTSSSISSSSSSSSSEEESSSESSSSSSSDGEESSKRKKSEKNLNEKKKKPSQTVDKNKNVSKRVKEARNKVETTNRKNKKADDREEGMEDEKRSRYRPRGQSDDKSRGGKNMNIDEDEDEKRPRRKERDSKNGRDHERQVEKYDDRKDRSGREGKVRDEDSSRRNREDDRGTKSYPSEERAWKKNSDGSGGRECYRDEGDNKRNREDIRDRQNSPNEKNCKKKDLDRVEDGRDVKFKEPAERVRKEGRDRDEDGSRRNKKIVADQKSHPDEKKCKKKHADRDREEQHEKHSDRRERADAKGRERNDKEEDPRKKNREDVRGRGSDQDIERGRRKKHGDRDEDQERRRPEDETRQESSNRKESRDDERGKRR